MTVPVPGNELVHLASDLQLLLPDPSRVLLLQPAHFLLKIPLFLLIPLLVPPIDVTLKRFFLLLPLLETSLLVLSQLPLQR